MFPDEERRGQDRRSPVGDFLLAALARRGGERVSFAELLEQAGTRGLSISSVLEWAARAEESGVVEQLAGDGRGERALRLTPRGLSIAADDRRCSQRRARLEAVPDDAG